MALLPTAAILRVLALIKGLSQQRLLFGSLISPTGPVAVLAVFVGLAVGAARKNVVVRLEPRVVRLDQHRLGGLEDQFGFTQERPP